MTARAPATGWRTTESAPKIAVLDDNKHGVCLDGRWKGWMFRRHADGYWVSLVKMTQEDALTNSPLSALFSPPLRADGE